MRYLSYILYLSLIVVFTSCAAQKGLKKTKHVTAEVKKAQLHVEIDDKQYDVTASMQTTSKSYAVLSITPLLGIELARIEAMEDSVWVIDKVHRQYSVVSYSQLNTIVRPSVHLKELEEIVMGIGLQEGQNTLSLNYKALNHSIKVDITYPNIVYDQPVNFRRQELSRYQRIPIQNLL